MRGEGRPLRGLPGVWLGLLDARLNANEVRGCQVTRTLQATPERGPGPPPNRQFFVRMRGRLAVETG
jgi:hypothetical protein